MRKPKTFRLRLTVTYFALIVIVLVICGISFFNIFKEYYIKNVESRLFYEARLVAQIIDKYEHAPGNKSYIQTVCTTAGRNTSTRVTIIDKKGVVLADSIYNSDKMDLHNTRPEVRQALEGKTGIDIRYSKTAHAAMIYAAVPFSGSELKGVVRLSTRLVAVEQLYRKIWLLLLLAIIMAGFIAFGISIIFAAKISRPLQEVTAAVEEMARGNLKKRIYYNQPDEVGVLADACNDMAQSLERNINEISEVKNRLETLLRNSVNGILMVDPEAKITYANPVAAALLGENKNIIGRKHVEVVNNYEMVEAIDTVRQEHKPICREIVLHNLGNKVVTVNAVPLLDEKVSYQGVLVVMNDITELKRLEQVRKDFVGNVSHELKTPIATISGFAETLVAEGQESQNVREFSGIIFTEARRLTRLINRLLELSRLESDRCELQLQPFDLNRLIKDTIYMAHEGNREENINIEFHSVPEPVTINGDKDMTAQIIINLLDNAIKYSNKAGTIDVYLEEQPEEVKISIRDYGVGIPQAETERIFERFYRVDKTRSRKTGGTGLGLAIVKHLVENIGGEVGVESIEGQGSTFTVTLPRNSACIQ